MKKIVRTSVHFDCGGKHSEEHEWISRNSVYSILFKTSSLEKITYSMLVDKICEKIAKDAAKEMLKLSYCLSKTRRETYVLDDDDVYIFLTALDLEGLKPVLHVETVNDLSSLRNVDNVCIAGIVTNVREDVREVVRDRETLEHQNQLIIQEVVEYSLNEDCENEGRENVSCNEIVMVDSPMLDYEYAEPPPPAVVEETSSTVVEWEDGTGLVKYQEFATKEAVWEVINRVANANCYNVKAEKSDPRRLMLRCCEASSGCNWYLRVAKIKNSNYWSVRVHRNMHTCLPMNEVTRYNLQRGTPRLVASLLHQDYPGQFDTPTPKNIMNLVQGRLGLHCSYSTALRGKKLHVSDVRGSPEASYKDLFQYLHMLKMVNPGTVTNVELDEDKRFKFLFIALGASIEGFSAMRKVIIVDATFLKTIYGGMLVFATAQDLNHHHYPIAFGVIDSENNVSWNWLFKNLKTVIPDVPGLVFISDKHGSIIKAVMELYPNAFHGHCVWHLSQNVRLKTTYDKDIAAEKFRELAHIYLKSEFDKEYVDFKSRFPRAGILLDDRVGSEKWARCYAEGDKYNIDTSNSAESMNGVFKEVRKYHLLPMIDAILLKFAEWFNKHRKDSASAPVHKKLVPVVENILNLRCKTAKKLQVMELNSYDREYNVIGVDGRTYMVNLIRKTCACRCFDIDKYPCVHALAAARKFMRNEWRNATLHIHSLCSPYYLIETWALAYCRTIYVVPHHSVWSIPPYVLAMFAKPPEYTTKNGRNQEERFPSVGEKRRKRTNNKANPEINKESFLQPE